MALYEDNSGKKYVELADLALRYGICPSWRDRDALAKHVSVLVNVKAQPDDVDTEPDVTELIIEGVEKKLSELTAKYEGLLDAVIGSCSLYEETNGLKFDYKAIRRWIYHNEPERVSAKIEDLTTR